MSVYELGKGVITKIWGRIGNEVFAFTKGGQPIARSVYRQGTRTQKQVAWGVEYNVVDEAWKNLTVEERNAWRKCAKGKAVSNYAAFMKLNLLRQRAGETLILICNK